MGSGTWGLECGNIGLTYGYGMWNLGSGIRIWGLESGIWGYGIWDMGFWFSICYLLPFRLSEEGHLTTLVPPSAMVGSVMSGASDVSLSRWPLVNHHGWALTASATSISSYSRSVNWASVVCMYVCMFEASKPHSQISPRSGLRIAEVALYTMLAFTWHCTGSNNVKCSVV